LLLLQACSRAAAAAAGQMTASLNHIELYVLFSCMQVYRQGLAAFQTCPPAAAAGQMAVKAFKKIKARLALPDKSDK
jgi:hypothetical protein